MAIKVYGKGFSTAAMRVLACLHEKGLGSTKLKLFFPTIHLVKFPPLKMVTWSFLVQIAITCNAKSRAITKYIAHAYADKGTPLISTDLKKRAIESVWEEAKARHYELPTSRLIWELGIKLLLGMTTDEAVIEEYKPELAKALDVYEARLTKSKYLGGDSFSLADLHHLPNMYYLMGTRIETLINSRPHVSAWCKDIMARPAWKKVVAMKDI